MLKEEGISATDSVTDLTDITEFSQKEEVNPPPARKGGKLGRGKREERRSY